VAELTSKNLWKISLNENLWCSWSSFRHPFFIFFVQAHNRFTFRSHDHWFLFDITDIMLKISFFEKTNRLNRTSSATKLELEQKMLIQLTIHFHITKSFKCLVNPTISNLKSFREVIYGLWNEQLAQFSMMSCFLMSARKNARSFASISMFFGFRGC